MGEKRFEDLLKRLEEIVSKLETNYISLEESLDLFEEGIGISKECEKILLPGQTPYTNNKGRISCSQPWIIDMFTGEGKQLLCDHWISYHMNPGVQKSRDIPDILGNPFGDGDDPIHVPVENAHPSIPDPPA